MPALGHQVCRLLDVQLKDRKALDLRDIRGYLIGVLILRGSCYLGVYIRVPCCHVLKAGANIHPTKPQAWNG